MSYMCEKCGYKHYESKGNKYKDHLEFRADKIKYVVDVSAPELQKDLKGLTIKPVGNLGSATRKVAKAEEITKSDIAEEMESRTKFHKYNEDGFPDRLVESVVKDETKKTRRGKLIKKHKILKWLN